MPSPSAQRYLPGGVPLIGAAHLVVMVATSPEHPVVPALQQTVAAGGGADAVLGVLQQWSTWGLPDFCVCERIPTGFRLLLRGGFEVRPDGETPINVRVEPWADGTVTNEAVTIRALLDPPRAEPAVAFYGGAALAGLVRFATGRAAELMTGDRAPAASSRTPAEPLEPAPQAPAPPAPVLPASAARVTLKADAAGAEPLDDQTMLVPDGWSLDAAPAAPAAAPLLLAVRCPAGHLTSPAAPFCRVCRAPVDPVDPIELPRPLLGGLRLPDGSVVPLDRDAVLGRRPTFPPNPAGESPRLVTLAGQGGVSARHLEVVLDGWDVCVRDLGSTNGTLITPPNGSALRLKPFELVAVEPGATISLAGEATVVFEVDPA